MKYERDKLLSSLKIIGQFVDKGGMLGREICFFPDKIVGYDGMVFIQIPFNFTSTLVVNLEKLLSVLSGMKAEEVDLDLEGNLLILSSEDTKAALKVSNSSETFEVCNEFNTKFSSLPKDLLDAMYLVSFSTSKDITNKAFSCVFVDRDIVFATDNFRMSKCSLEEPLETSFLIPASSVNKLATFSKNSPLVGFSCEKSWIHFKDEQGVIFSCQLVLDESFPTRDEILPFFSKIKGESFEFPPDIREAIKTVSFLVKDQFELDRVISISVKRDKIICKAEKEGEWIEKSIPFRGDKEFQFLCNPTFMTEALERAFEVTISDRGILFRSQSKTFEHLIAPCLEEDKE